MLSGFSLSRGGRIVAGSLFATLIIWISTLSDYGWIAKDPFLFLSKIVALLGTVCMCWAFFLSTRLRFFENLFSGLDKLYHAHRVVGIAGFSLVCLHPIFQFLRFVPHWKRAWRLFAFREFGPIEFGLAALILLIGLMAATLWIRLPYQIWKRSHQMLIFVLLLAFTHVVWIDGQINDSILLSVWMYGFMALAFASYVYIRFLYRYLGPKYFCRVDAVEKIGKVWNLVLRPEKGTAIAFKPAQFVYLSFPESEIGPEAHPFSISSSPDDPFIRLSIKKLGDYTSRMGVINKNDKAVIRGPYGRFSDKYFKDKRKDAVMIAGGIGITPFLSMLQYEVKHPENRTTYLFYCVKNPGRAYFHKEIEDIVKRNPKIIYFPRYTDSEGLLDAQTLSGKLHGGLKGKNYFLCGPYSMMDFFTRQLSKSGIKNREIVFEDFNLLD